MPNSTKGDPPLIDVKVTNPITYLKLWWKRVMNNEGVDFRFRIHPLTAIAIALVITGSSFSVGHFIFPPSVFAPNSSTVKLSPTPTPTPNQWEETAFKGTLHKSSTNHFYLLTTSSEAINLDLPINIDLTKYVNKRILAFGSYNQKLRVLRVTEAADLELLSAQPTSIPTVVPTLAPIASPTSSTVSAPVEPTSLGEN